MAQESEEYRPVPLCSQMRNAQSIMGWNDSRWGEFKIWRLASY